MKINALTVCVEYDDLLAITLPVMARAFERVCVVTAPGDQPTILLAESQDNCFTHQTDAFIRNGATFNKGLAIEEGLDMLGRNGWICLIDADIVLPEPTRFGGLDPNFLYGAKRKLCPKPEEWDGAWLKWRVVREVELGGYFHLFHADHLVLKDKPWYGVDWRHAGGYDSQFESRWPAQLRRNLPFQVMHLGPLKTNWWGRQTPRLDGSEPVQTDASEVLMKEMLSRRREGDYDWERLQTSKAQENNR